MVWDAAHDIHRDGHGAAVIRARARGNILIVCGPCKRDTPALRGARVVVGSPVLFGVVHTDLAVCVCHVSKGEPVTYNDQR